MGLWAGSSAFRGLVFRISLPGAGAWLLGSATLYSVTLGRADGVASDLGRGGTTAFFEAACSAVPGFPDFEARGILLGEPAVRATLAMGAFLAGSAAELGAGCASLISRLLSTALAALLVALLAAIFPGVPAVVASGTAAGADDVVAAEVGAGAGVGQSARVPVGVASLASAVLSTTVVSVALDSTVRPNPSERIGWNVTGERKFLERSATLASGDSTGPTTGLGWNVLGKLNPLAPVTERLIGRRRSMWCGVGLFSSSEAGWKIIGSGVAGGDRFLRTPSLPPSSPPLPGEEGSGSKGGKGSRCGRVEYGGGENAESGGGVGVGSGGRSDDGGGVVPCLTYPAASSISTSAVGCRLTVPVDDNGDDEDKIKDEDDDVDGRLHEGPRSLR